MAYIDWTGRSLSDKAPFLSGREAIVDGKTIAVFFSADVLAAVSVYRAMDKAEEKIERALSRGEFPDRVEVTASDLR
jgi:hypothetical protein